MPLIREAAANESFKNLDALEAALDKRCIHLMQHPELVQAKANL